MVEVRNNGVPLLEQFPKAGLTQAVVTLADALAGEAAAGASDPKSPGTAGWLNFWASRKSNAK
jgi:pilus assembly protein CpaE